MLYFLKKLVQLTIYICVSVYAHSMIHIHMLHNNAEPYNTYIKESSLDINYNSAATPLLVKNGHKAFRQNVPTFSLFRPYAHQSFLPT
jgi:hypothetical protein